MLSPTIILPHPIKMVKCLKQCFEIQKLPKGTSKAKLSPKLPFHTSMASFHISKKLSLEDLNDTAFIFQFDESTTQQLNKQYDGYVQYWPKKHKSIKIAYYGTVMVDHTAEKLLEHFLELVRKFMLGIGMNGPNINVKFERLLKSSENLKFE